jgi:hypothetical protein
MASPEKPMLACSSLGRRDRDAGGFSLQEAFADLCGKGVKSFSPWLGTSFERMGNCLWNAAFWQLLVMSWGV